MEWIQFFDRRLKGWPEWLRPLAYGPMFLAYFIFMRAGGRIGLMVAGVISMFLLLQSRTPIDDLGKALLLVFMAVTGSALCGPSYSLLGRFSRRVPIVGPYLAGTTTVAPYMVSVVIIVRLV